MEKAINSFKYENEINFPIEVVKNALKDILSKNRTRFMYDDNGINDMFGTYNFGEIKCSYMVTLSSVEENKTKIVLTCSERYGLETSPATLELYVGEFLAILSAKLSGKKDDEMVNIVNANNSNSKLSVSSTITQWAIWILTFITSMLILSL